MSEEKKVKFKEVSPEDWELILAWRSNPKIFKYFRNQEGPISWEEHVKFWNQTKDEKRRDWVILYRSNICRNLKKSHSWRRVGVVHVTDLDLDHPEVGLFIGEVDLWGQGIGKLVLEKVREWLESNNYRGAKALIFKSNERSKELFTGLGFKKREKVSSGWFLYKLEL